MLKKILVYTGKFILSGFIWYSSGEIFPDNEITLNNIYEDDNMWPFIVYIVRISWSSIPWLPW